MKITEDFEVIIIGAGLSGLTLAKEICDRTNYKILILEKKKKFKFDKNWCFWNRPENPFTNNFDHAWEKISVNIDGKEKILHDKNADNELKNMAETELEGLKVEHIKIEKKLTFGFATLVLACPNEFIDLFTTLDLDEVAENYKKSNKSL